ncbi:MAG: TRAP transporter small permease [Firmicutes bacterium]|nr:TRAP transporter small permease [Bacillota bacterium]
MLNKLGKILEFDVIISGIALVILIILTFLGSVLRYLFNNPIIWLEEVQLALFLWVVFLGGSAVFRKGSHVAIDLIVDKLSGKLKILTELLIYLVGILVLAYFTYGSNLLVNQFIKRNRVTNILKIPSQYIYIVVPIGCILMILNYTLSMYKRYLKNNT